MRKIIFFIVIILAILIIASIIYIRKNRSQLQEDFSGTYTYSSGEVNIDYPYNDIKKFNNISLEDCKDECAKNSSCRGLTYEPSGSTCWIKKDMKNRRSASNRDSYIVTSTTTTNNEGVIEDSGCQPYCQYPDGVTWWKYHYCVGSGNCPSEWDSSYWNDTAGRVLRNFTNLNQPLYDNNNNPIWNSTNGSDQNSSSWISRFGDLWKNQFPNDKNHIQEMLGTRWWINPLMYTSDGNLTWKWLAVEIAVNALDYTQTMITTMSNVYQNLVTSLTSIITVTQASTMFIESIELIFMIDGAGYNTAKNIIGYEFVYNQPFLEVATALFYLGIYMYIITVIYYKEWTWIPPNSVANILKWFEDAISESYKYLDLKRLSDLNQTNNVYNILKSEIDSFAGNEYLSNNYVPKDSDITESSKIPMNVQQDAYDKFLYATLSNCYKKYNPQGINNLPDIIDRIEQMDNARSLLSSSTDQTNSPTKIIEAINLSREVFWDKTKNAWRTGDNKDNYSNCNPIENVNGKRQIQPGTIPSTFYSFKTETEKAELKNKQLLNIAENLFKSIFGEDASFVYPWWTTPDCPAVKNQSTTNVMEWVREDDDTQSDICKSDPISTYKEDQYVNGTMKPGKIVNGKDIWIENASNIKKNMDNIGQITNATNIGNNNYNGNVAPKWRAMWSLGAGQIQNVLQDRDFELSVDKWKSANDQYNKNTYNFIRETIIPVYNNLNKIFVSGSSDSSTPDNQFKIAYESEGQTKRLTLNTLWSPSEVIPGIKNITINDSKPNKHGLIRIYKNAYQYDDYSSSTNYQSLYGGSLKNLSNLQTDIFSLVYIPLAWDIAELANDRRDVYIICSNNQSFTQNGYTNLYSSQNWFMGKHVYNEFEKCFYAKKKNSPSGAPYGSGKDQLNMKWAIISNAQNKGSYRLFNTETKSYLCWGKNYDVQKNFKMGTNLPDGAFDQNKKYRQNILYFVSQERFSDECNKGTQTCTGLQEDSLWTFKSLGNNKYQIYHQSGNQLWFTANMILLSNNNQYQFSPITESIKELLGMISCSDKTTSDSSLPNWCAQNSSREGCFNTEFIIVPVEPTNITQYFQNSDLSDGKVNSGMYNRKLNRFSNGSYDNGVGTWFSTITQENPYSYADLGIDGKYIGDTDANTNTKQANPFANIYEYSMNANEPLFNTLVGGGGDTCSLSNFTYPERQMLPGELYADGWSKAYDGIDFRGNDIGSQTNQTLESCKQLCIKNENCVGITYVPSTKTCYPKNAITNQVPASNLTSYMYNRNSSEKFTKIGPYKDEEDRALRYYAGMASNANECSSMCSEYQYFSLQDHNGNQSQCFCENDLDHAKKYGSSNCDELGSAWCNYIYKQKSNVPEMLNVGEEEAYNAIQDQSNTVKTHLMEYEDPKDKPFSTYGWPWPNEAPHNYYINTKAPLNRHAFICKPNEFLVVNVEALLSKNFSFMNNRQFTSYTNPNISYIFDLQDSMNTESSGFTDWYNKRVAIMVWSSTASYIEGNHFGISPYGNYIWWSSSIDPSKIKFYYQTLGEMTAKYISLYNYSGTDNFKTDKTTLCQWFDIYRFRSLGWTGQSTGILYGYSKTINQGNTFIEIV